MKPTLLVLAAGMGSRYGGLKQLDPVGPSGETIIDYSVHDAIEAGFGKIVFVIRPDFAELFKDQIGSKCAGRIPVSYAYQELNKLPRGFSVPEGRTKPWGTGHAVLMAADLIREPFAMINADDFYGRASFDSMARFLGRAEDAAKASYAMVGYALKATLSENGTVSRGLCELNAQGELLRVVEHTKIAKTAGGAIDEPSGKALYGSEIVSMNFFGFTPSFFVHLQQEFNGFLRQQGQDLRSEFYVPGVVDTLIQNGKASVKVLGGSDHWFGVTYPEDKALVVAGIQALVAKGLYPSKLP